jgi:hypothetical protein
MAKYGTMHSAQLTSMAAPAPAYQRRIISSIAGMPAPASLASAVAWRNGEMASAPLKASWRSWHQRRGGWPGGAETAGASINGNQLAAAWRKQWQLSGEAMKAC